METTPSASKPAQFHPFLRLPSELRLQIWHYALENDWTWTRIDLRGCSRLKTGIRQSCAEARAEMRKTHTLVRGLGWVDFSRHVVILWGIGDEGFLFDTMKDPFSLLRRAQNLVARPRSWYQLELLFCRLGQCCPLLRKLVISSQRFNSKKMAESPAVDREAEGVPEAVRECVSTVHRINPRSENFVRLHLGRNSGPIVIRRRRALEMLLRKRYSRSSGMTGFYDVGADISLVSLQAEST